AEITALAAIELGGCRHELALRLSILGQHQALGHGERGIVPGLIFVRLIEFGARGIGGFGLAVDSKIGGKKAVQPGALLGRERRVLWDQRGNGRHRVHAASARSGARSASSRSVAISWRRQNSKNDSPGAWRWASQAASKRSSSGGRSSKGPHWGDSRALACSAGEGGPPPGK